MASSSTAEKTVATCHDQHMAAAAVGGFGGDVRVRLRRVGRDLACR